MLKKKIIEYFDKNPDIKILFFFDPDKEYQEVVDNMELQDITILKPVNSQFKLKYQLEFEYKNRKVFLYLKYPRPEENQCRDFLLLDLLLANKELHLDEVSNFLEAYNLNRRYKHLVEKYIKELKTKKVQDLLAPILTPQKFREDDLLLGLIANTLNMRRLVNANLAMARIIQLSLDPPKLSTALVKLAKLKLDETIKNWLKYTFDLQTETLSPETIQTMVCKLKYNLITQNFPTLQNDHYKHLKIPNLTILNRLNQLMMDWESDIILSQNIADVFSKTGEAVKETELVACYGVDAPYTYFTDQLRLIIISELLDDIHYNPDKQLAVLSTLDIREPASPNIAKLIRFLQYSAEFYRQFNSISNYTLDDPVEYINSYASQWYRQDTAYRKALQILSEIDTVELPESLDLNSFSNKLHDSYEKYLQESNRQWLDCLKNHHYEFKRIPVARQHDFYKTNISKEEKKVAVIISDALRYEAGQELLDQLHSDTKSEATITHMLASLPSTTVHGIANLLPGSTLTFENRTFLIDGINTEGTTKREKILQQAKPDSSAILYNDLDKYDQKGIRDYFKKDVIYIFHNVIDAIGDDRKTESRTVSAVADAIRELSILIKKLHSSWNVAKVLITSDHGFLFTPRPLPESMRENRPKQDGIFSHNRFEITADPTPPETGHRFKLSKAADFETEMDIVIPNSINRFKRKGCGELYVHGGASLQELIIPLIESRRKREDIAKKVDIRLMSTNLKIVSGILKVRLLQEKKVSRYEKVRTAVAAIYHHSGPVSPKERIIFDSISDMASDRQREVILKLKQNAGSHSYFTLKLFDEDDPLNPLIEEQVVNKTLIGADF